MAVHLASLELFHQAGIDNLRNKSIVLTNYLEFILEDAKSQNANLSFEIITPKQERGAQLSLLTDSTGKALFDHLLHHNIIADWREPNVIRIAPTPMYNSFLDVYLLGKAMISFSNH